MVLQPALGVSPGKRYCWKLLDGELFVGVLKEVLVAQGSLIFEVNQPTQTQGIAGLRKRWVPLAGLMTWELMDG